MTSYGNKVAPQVDLTQEMYGNMKRMELWQTEFEWMQMQ